MIELQFPSVWVTFLFFMTAGHWFGFANPPFSPLNVCCMVMPNDCLLIFRFQTSFSNTKRFGDFGHTEIAVSLLSDNHSQQR